VSRVEVIGAATLYLGDAREIGPGLGRFDACVTDMPYGIKSRGQRGFDVRTLKGIKVTRHEWEVIEGDSEPFDPAWLLAAGYPKLVFWGANHFASRLPDSPSWIIWDKRENVAPDDNGDAEMAWTNLGGPLRIHRQLWKGICRAGEENIARAGAKLHHHQKPVALLSYCIDRCKLSPRSTVLDPYMGSGSCGIAALRAGHSYVGIEIDPIHFDTACRRIEDAQRQGSLFGEQAA
jgi:site-specific DNA-methyltransferase (adenine-specific)